QSASSSSSKDSKDRSCVQVRPKKKCLSPECPLLLDGSSLGRHYDRVLSKEPDAKHPQDIWNAIQGIRQNVSRRSSRRGADGPIVKVRLWRLKCFLPFRWLVAHSFAGASGERGDDLVQILSQTQD